MSRAETLLACPLFARPAVFFPLPFVGTVTGRSRSASACPSGVMDVVLLRGICTKVIIIISAALDSGGNSEGRGKDCHNIDRESYLCAYISFMRCAGFITNMPNSDGVRLSLSK